MTATSALTDWSSLPESVTVTVTLMDPPSSDWPWAFSPGRRYRRASRRPRSRRPPEPKPLQPKLTDRSAAGRPCRRRTTTMNRADADRPLQVPSENCWSSAALRLQLQAIVGAVVRRGLGRRRRRRSRRSRWSRGRGTRGRRTGGRRATGRRARVGVAAVIVVVAGARRHLRAARRGRLRGRRRRGRGARRRQQVGRRLLGRRRRGVRRRAARRFDPLAVAAVQRAHRRRLHGCRRPRRSRWRPRSRRARPRTTPCRRSRSCGRRTVPSAPARRTRRWCSRCPPAPDPTQTDSSPLGEVRRTPSLHSGPTSDSEPAHSTVTEPPRKVSVPVDRSRTSPSRPRSTYTSSPGVQLDALAAHVGDQVHRGSAVSSARSVGISAQAGRAGSWCR